MNILNIYDYLYYRTYNIYLTKWKESMPWLYALGLVSIVQVSNLFILIFIYEYIFNYDIADAKYGSIFAIGVIVINYIRYHSNRKNFKSLSKKWDNEGYANKKKRGTILAIFIVISFLVCLGTAILLGEIDQGRL